MKNTNINQLEIEEVSKKNNYFSIIESLLFVSGEPMKLRDIASIIECSLIYTRSLLKELSKQYEDSKRGIKIIKTEDMYQLVTKSENSEFVEKILSINSRQSLSQAALETLAIIAYKQPVTRIDIDEIRGVKSDSAIQKLLERNLIKERGRLEVPGRPILYGTTEEFLKQFDLENLKELPSLSEFILEEEPEEHINLLGFDEVAAEKSID